ncbi:MAG: hypothetical protein R3C11_12670 [Planctomycetaceae bacterium]
MFFLKYALNSASWLLAQAPPAVEEESAGWSMLDVTIVVLVLLALLTAVCKSSQRH